MKGNGSGCLCLILLLLDQTSFSKMFQVLGPADPVVAHVGEDLVLPCHLKPNISAEDMRVEWIRLQLKDRLVHLYREKKNRNEDQILSYRGRTALFLDELNKGNTSLRLTRVRGSDEGRYQCFIQSQQWDDDASIKVEVRVCVSVGTEPVISTEGHRDGGISLLCESKGWDLQPELIWLDSEGQSLPAGPTETHRDSMDLLIVRRRVIIQDRDTKSITCRVQLQQRSVEKEAEFDITERVTQNQDELSPLTNESIIKAQQKLKTDLKKKFECIQKGLGLAKHSLSTLLHEIDTEIYIIEGGSGGSASKRQTPQETAVLCNDIFNPLPGENKDIRTVLMKGISGIGKTVSVQKFILDWAEGKANQDIHFIFPLPFRDLSLKKERKFSLMQLLQICFPELREIKRVEHDEVKVLFIFDGLDECRMPLDFQNSEILCDVTESTSIDLLLINIIKGNLLPSALIWITSPPVVANQIPAECVHRVTEVRGFNDPQKEEYFNTRVGDQNLANRIISHINSTKNLNIMCHIPVFCWISAAVLETVLGEGYSGELPKTVTEMYTYFLLLQTNVKNDKYSGTNKTNPEEMSVSDTEIILKLGKLAFQQLEKSNLIFCKKDLRECGIAVSEALVYSEVCPAIFKKESGLYQKNVFSFVHLSIHEYLAAFYVFHSFVIENRNVLRPDESRPEGDKIQLSEIHRSAVDDALQSKEGQLDLFLRFLLGLSLDTNHILLQGLLKQIGGRSQSIEETVEYIKEKLREESSAERAINLFQCISELNANSLVEEIQKSVRSGSLSHKELEPDQCSALAFVLLMSEEVLDVFDLKMYDTSAAGHQRLLPVVKNCRKAMLDSHDLTHKSCDTVASALQSVPTHLTELIISYNNLGDSGVEQLCAGLKSPNCKLERLILDSCNLTEKSCETVASALQSVPSHLIELDLSFNQLRDSGVERLCAGLKSPNCKLQGLRLDSCELTEESCDTMAFALQSGSSHLIELDLSCNNLGDSGVERLCAGLKSPKCELRRLGLSGCRITETGCVSLASALRSNPSQMRELDLSSNHLGDSGMRALSTGLEDPSCKLATLLLCECNLTEDCCDDLASVLCSPHSELRDLQLRDNDLLDSGVRVLSAALEDRQCELQRLGLSGCRVTERGCASLASALCSNPSHLRELDMSYNHLGDSGGRAFSAVLEDPSSKLETVLVDHGEKSRDKPGLLKYACQLTLDPNTAHRNLALSEGDRKVTWGIEQPYPDHPERFDHWEQVLCREGLSGTRCYWEAEWSESGEVDIAVTYKGISRKGEDTDCVFGENINSWTMFCSDVGYSVYHNDKRTDASAPPSPSHRIGVYLDWPAGILSFYSVSSDTLTLLYRIHTTFTEPLYPGFGVLDSMSLCHLE
ncbi:NACHT, LRR and PYD domains-containing protein 12 [Megalops cyprinoides]|uniref:NACHT, LRR and PYD domains-containing protein 12 n=1 Tax=Megalops cyprinoides TaxID=118141 RepID=UPI001863F1B9|nr:NACHT, LRR and PYD domains-containing protein 12 [Megalops cyprinoides]